MFKRKLCFLLAFSFLLTGCSSVSMTQAESGQVAEYIAYSLLKYHKNPGAFVSKQDKKKDLEDKVTEEVVSAVPTGNSNTNSATTEPIVSSSTTVAPENYNSGVGELFGSKDFKVSVRRKGLYTSYPKNASSTYFALTAKEGKKLFVLELSAKNIGDTNQIFKTRGVGLEYAINEESSNAALVTILEHDIHFVKETVKPGKSIKALIFFEVDERFDDSSCSISISNAEKSVTVPVI